ncbi:MAG: hypothetical protein KBA66_22500 [Leptospiraceae bacterium]|nr:hypothetical protein [Leptospiraceae bacterium]
MKNFGWNNIVMRKLILLIFLFSFFQCSSLQNYAKNRALDFTDILTIGGEVNIYGGSAWFWCFGGGVQVGRYTNGYGMRNGYVGSYYTGGYREFANLKMGNSFLIMNSQEHIPTANKTTRSMHKKYTHANFFFLLPANLKGRYRETGSSPSGFAYNSLPALCHAPATLELSFGLGVGGRVGFNISELVDFLLGFTTYDLMNDDLKSKIEEVEE